MSGNLRTFQALLWIPKRLLHFRTYTYTGAAEAHYCICWHRNLHTLRRISIYRDCGIAARTQEHSSSIRTWFMQGWYHTMYDMYGIVREKITDRTKSTDKGIHHPKRCVRPLRIPKQVHSVPRPYKVVYNRSDSVMHSGASRTYDAAALCCILLLEGPLDSPL